jgi:hypothetical protein
MLSKVPKNMKLQQIKILKSSYCTGDSQQMRDPNSHQPTLRTVSTAFWVENSWSSQFNSRRFEYFVLLITIWVFCFAYHNCLVVEDARWRPCFRKTKHMNICCVMPSSSFLWLINELQIVVNVSVWFMLFHEFLLIKKLFFPRNCLFFHFEWFTVLQNHHFRWYICKEKKNKRRRE